MTASAGPRPKRSVRRVVAICALALLCAPGTFLRTEVAGRKGTTVAIAPLAFDTATIDGFTIEGLWRLNALNENFGGYSAMKIGGDFIRLFSDKGWLLTFARPDVESERVTKVRQLYPTSRPLAELLDIESVTTDWETGQYWVGYENYHTIYRYSAAGEPEAWVEPPYAANWYANSGIEAMARLRDGRFLLLRETKGMAYLYDGDPVEGGDPLAFHVDLPDGFLPTDMAELPDGRVMIVLRATGWHLPIFESLLAVADPATIEPDSDWQVTVLTRIEDFLPRDNYEAIAIEPADDGQVTVWLASDDNKSAFQQSLVAKLSWDPATVPVADQAAGR